jgi:hypothetical protein
MIGNPNHPVVKEFESQWYKLCAIVMWKAGLDTVQITSDDIDGFAVSGKANIVANTKGGKLTLSIVSAEVAERLARAEGGLAQ